MNGRSSGVLAIGLAIPSLAMAHTGPLNGSGFLQGFAHPMGGVDHLLAMLAVGLLAAQAGGRALWAVPCTFLAVMILGSLAGFGGAGLPYVELGISGSVLVLGVLIAAAIRLPLIASATIIGGFAVFHGYAHAAEMPAASNMGHYLAGFVMATALLHAAGMAAGLAAGAVNLRGAMRLVGGTVALCGAYLALA